MKKAALFLLAILLLLAAPGCSADPDYEVQSSAPALTLRYDGQEFQTRGISMDWSYLDAEGQRHSRVPGTIPPTDEGLRNSTPVLTISEEMLQVELSWPIAPESYSIRCWPVSSWGDWSASGTTVSTTDNSLELEPDMIYQVQAKWSKWHFSGTSSHWFQTVGEPGVSPAPLTDAPELTVSCAGQTITAPGGTIYWDWDNGDGTRGHILTDRLHPLDEALRDNTPVLTPDSAGLALLHWDESPDSFTFSRWSGDSWGNFEAEEERVPVNSLTVRLEPGYIYRVFASWDRENYNGTAEYQFQTV